MNLFENLANYAIKKIHINGQIVDQLNKIKELELKLKTKEIEIEEIKKRYEIIASTDYLTNIANRRAFDTAYIEACRIALRKKTPLSLIMIDIDYYKEFNDTYGHIWGDECLKKIALEISKVLTPSEFIARYGGEEFIILIPNSNAERVISIAQDVIQSIQNLQIPHTSSKVANYVTVSAGIVNMVLEDENSAKSLLLLADDALYEAKESGRNRISRKIVSE